MEDLGTSPPRRGEMPPFGWIGGQVPWFAVLAENSDSFVVLHDVVSYPHGLTFAVTVNAVDAPGRDLNDVLFGHSDDWLGLTVVFADGRVATLRDRHEDLEPDTPILQLGRSSSHGGDHYTADLEGWLWPVPPSGPTRWIVEIPALDVRSELVLDGAEAVVAASRARKVIEWHDQSAQVEAVEHPGTVDLQDDGALVAALAWSISQRLPPGFGVVVDGRGSKRLARPERERRLRRLAAEGKIDLSEHDSGNQPADPENPSGTRFIRSRGMSATHGDDVADEVRSLFNVRPGLGLFFTHDGVRAWRSNVGEFLQGMDLTDPARYHESAARSELVMNAARGALLHLQTYLSHALGSRWPERDARPDASSTGHSLELWYATDGSRVLEFPPIEFG